MTGLKGIVFEQVAQVLGNGEARGLDLAWAIATRLQEARAKHPHFASDRWQAMAVIRAEYLEFEHAIAWQTEKRQRDEALDVIVTCIRFLNGEHERA